MSRKTAPNIAPPEGLIDPVRDWFLAMIDAYEGFTDEPNAVSILTEAAVQLQRCLQSREVIDREGIAVLDRFGKIRENPLCVTERAAANLHRLLVRELGLEPSAVDETNRITRNQNLRIAR